MLRSGFSVRDPSQPHFELVNNISSLIQQGSDVITKYSVFVSKLQQNEYQFHFLFHYRATSTRDRRLAGRLVRSFTSIMISSLPHCPLHLAVYFFFYPDRQSVSWIRSSNCPERLGHQADENQIRQCRIRINLLILPCTHRIFFKIKIINDHI